MDAQELEEQEEYELFYCAGDYALEKIAQRGCGAFLTGDFQEPSRHNHVKYSSIYFFPGSNKS